MGKTFLSKKDTVESLRAFCQKIGAKFDTSMIHETTTNKFVYNEESVRHTQMMPSKIKKQEMKTVLTAMLGAIKK